MRALLFTVVMWTSVFLLTCVPRTVQAIETGAVREIVKAVDHGILSPRVMFPLERDRMLITDTAGRALYCFDLDGQRQWRTDGTETGETGFLFPGMIASSRGLNVFVVDSGLRKIFKFDRRGAFAGYLVNQSVENPSCIAQGEGGELYIYDNTSWELTCVETKGTLRWKVKPWKLTGEVTSMRLADGGIHLLVPGESTIYSYGKFGEYIRSVRLDCSPVAFWPGSDGRLYVCTKDGSVMIYDTLYNPLITIDSLEGKKLESPCDLFLSGNRLYLLDCGTQTVHEITIR